MIEVQVYPADRLCSKPHAKIITFIELKKCTLCGCNPLHNVAHSVPVRMTVIDYQVLPEYRFAVIGLDT